MWPTALVLLAAFTTGCAIKGPPAPPLAASKVIAALRQRSEALHTLKASRLSLRITVRREGKTERLPRLGAVAAFDFRRPALSLLADKLGQSVFWLRARPEGFWVGLPRSREVALGSAAAYGRLPYALSPSELLALTGDPAALGLDRPGARMEVGPECYRFVVPVLGRPYRQVLVDRRLLTVREISVLDALGQPVTVIALSNYEDKNGLLLPHRIELLRVKEGVRMELRLKALAPNVPVARGAFEPGPTPPGWRVVDLDRQPLSDLRAFGAAP